MNFGQVKNRLRSVYILEIVNDLEYGRLCAIEMQPRVRTKSVTPRWAKKNYNKIIRRMSVRGHQILIATADEINRRVEVSDILNRQIINDRFDLKTNPLRSA